MSKPIILAPSILSANLAALGNEVREVLKYGAHHIHFDVMDNHFVPNLTFGPMICKALREDGITAPIDVHLMVEGVDDLITQFAKAGANEISIHPESTKHLDRSLQLIIDSGVKAGIALNPTTPLNILDYCLDKIDKILVMLVNPGFGGQKMIQSAVDKINHIKTLAPNHEIQVDGGVSASNIKQLHDLGATNFVAGSAIFGQKDRKKAIQNLLNVLK